MSGAQDIHYKTRPLHIPHKLLYCRTTEHGHHTRSTFVLHTVHTQEREKETESEWRDHSSQGSFIGSGCYELVSSSFSYSQVVPCCSTTYTITAQFSFNSNVARGRARAKKIKSNAFFPKKGEIVKISKSFLCYGCLTRTYGRGGLSFQPLVLRTLYAIVPCIYGDRRRTKGLFM